MFYAPDSSPSSQNHNRKTIGKKILLNSSMDRDPQKGIGNLEAPKCAHLIQSQGLEFMGRGHDLFTLRDWGYLEKVTFWRRWQTSLVVCLSLLGMAIPKSLYQLPSMVMRSSAWKNKIRALWLQKLLFSAPRLLLLPVKPTACQLICGWLPHAPSFLYTCLALPWPPKQNQHRAQNSPLWSTWLQAQRHNCPPSLSDSRMWHLLGLCKLRKAEIETQTVLLGIPTPLSQLGVPDGLLHKSLMKDTSE